MGRGRLSWLALVIASCGGELGTPVDAGSADATSIDSGTPDAGAPVDCGGALLDAATCSREAGLVLLAPNRDAFPAFGGIGVDGANVYWTASVGGGAAVLECAVGGCGGNPTVLAQGGGHGASLTVGGGNVFWSDLATGSVMKCSTSGCGGKPTVLATDKNALYGGIAVDGTSVYWVATTGYSQTSENIMKCSVGGCAGNPTVLASAQTQASRIAVDDTNVYWVSTNAGDPFNQTPFQSRVNECATGGCGGAPTVLASDPFGVPGLAVDGTNVYWISEDSTGNTTVKECARCGCGGNPTVLASGPVGLSTSTIAVDGISVYWSGAGKLMKCAIGGCGGNPTVLPIPGWTPYALAVDCGGLFWTDQVKPDIESGASPLGAIGELTPK